MKSSNAVGSVCLWGELDLANAEFNAAVSCNREGALANYSRDIVREEMGGQGVPTVEPEERGTMMLQGT